MWLFSLSFIDDSDHGRLGRPLFFLEMEPMLKIGPEPNNIRNRRPITSAVEAAAPLPDGREPTCYMYRCPTCMKEHAVNEVRHRLAYGRQLTCSCNCEIQRRKMIKKKWRSMSPKLPNLDK